MKKLNEKPMFYGAKSRLFHFAKSMRHEKSTKAEQVLWKHLKSKKLGGFKFRQQHPMGNYIADFYCHAANLVIELDGEYHFEKEQQSNDEFRTKVIETAEIKVIRFSNSDVFEKIDWVLEEILKKLNGIENN